MLYLPFPIFGYIIWVRCIVSIIYVFLCTISQGSLFPSPRVHVIVEMIVGALFYFVNFSFALS
ncbi:hypothetical protein BDZ91DRAFT_711187 [Kalaharituber pfeilii]|nr:hypothetical protein BDZ91DRAFT_711187 [Kalaharituber pfeilii]